MAVVVKIANQRHGYAHAVKLLADVGHGLRGFGGVYRDAHKLRASYGQLLDLNGCAYGVSRVGIGHGLHAHGRITAYGDYAVAVPDGGLQGLVFTGCSQWHWCLQGG